MKKIAYHLAAIFLLAGCSTPVATGGSGHVRLAVLWPNANFQTLALPTGTQALSIRITGLGLTQAFEKRLARNDQPSQTLVIELPQGPKAIDVKALSSQNEILAEDQQQIEIQVSQVTRLEMDLREVPKPTPTPNPNLTNNQPASSLPGPTAGSPPPSPGQSEPSTNPVSEPTPVASLSPVTQASPTSVPSSNNGGGGGGNSSSGSGTNSVVMTLSADPNPVSGMNFPTGLKVSFNNATLATDLLTQLSQNKASLNWTCTDSAQNTGCGAFSTGSDAMQKFWIPPFNQSGIFTLSLDITDQNSLHYQSSVTVTVLQGIGSITAGSGGFDGGETGGQ